MIYVDTVAISALGTSIEREVGPDLDRASGQLKETRAIEHSNFTTVVPSLAVVYVAAVEFVEEELKSKRSHLGEIKSRLEQTAKNWDAAEESSTIQVGSCS